MPRYKLILEYDGAGFVGWQRQDNGPSIQAALEDAIQGYCGAVAETVAAGRTDAGVHALGQVVHADLPPADPGTIRDAVNAHLRPAAIAVVDVTEMPDDFHARFSATRRAYRYRIVNRRPPLVHDRGRAWRVPQPLDADAMAEAARELVGHHDFSSFRAAECQAKSPLKTLDALTVARDGDRITIEARARSFLHNQVRIMVGTLVRAGTGKWTSLQVAEILAARDRTQAGPTAPPEGLFLIEVGYD